MSVVAFSTGFLGFSNLSSHIMQVAVQGVYGVIVDQTREPCVQVGGAPRRCGRGGAAEITECSPASIRILPHCLSCEMKTYDPKAAPATLARAILLPQAQPDAAVLALVLDMDTSSGRAVTL